MRIFRFSALSLLTICLILSCSTDADPILEEINSELETESESETETESGESGNSARLTAKNLFLDYYEASRTTGNESAWMGDEPACNAGIVPEDVKAKILQRLFYYRQAVSLNNELVVNPDKSDKAQEAALMMQANNTLDHFPPDTWKCFSTAGKEGAGNSLLTTAKNAEAIDSYMRDAGSANGPVGHRRWLLWPELSEIGIGNTNGANAIWVLNGGGASLTNTPEYITWPPKGFVPEQLVFPRWSFSLKNADFTNAQVSMSDTNGNTIELSTEELSNQFADRTIVWVPSGIAAKVTEDTLYTVSISGVEINGETKDFTYTVTIFDPSK